ncbi:MAG: M42 family metallopeptidase [Mobilibacterium timonense]|uniref:M42 family metallopeptidase n=1 Tax=Mobilibacterium timonense TaxID=1871012 RepID=UPI002353F41C|nr:M42 family metallopeptidase [Mobilibacterium timonense]MBM6989922.1 M42 family metallopeptidase [Mobilibacterium timonense]
MELLKELTQAWGVSGREKNVRKIIREQVKVMADEVVTDAMGNLIVLKKGNGSPDGKKIMFSAHMDEIGFQVTHIMGDGRVKVCNVGWTWTSSAYNDKVVFQNGTIGVVGCDGPVEEAKNKAQQLYIDIGCDSKEETEKYVQVGDYAGFIGNWYEMKGDKITAKTFDDRAGCYAMIKALEKNDGSGPNDVYYVFSVQEEVGCRGAVTSAERIRPDIGVSIDVSPDHYYPNDLTGANKVGAGVGVTIGNPSAMLDEYLVNEMLACCQENEIPYQRDVMDRGGTDASSINQSGIGVRVAGISIIDRFPHSQSSVISKKDLEATIDLIDKYSKRTFRFEEEW